LQNRFTSRYRELSEVGSLVFIAFVFLFFSIYSQLPFKVEKIAVCIYYNNTTLQTRPVVNGIDDDDGDDVS